MLVLKGGMYGEVVNVMRDTGCSCAVVHRNLVPSSQFTGKHQACVLIDGSVWRFPLALIQVDTPYYSGDLEVLCMKSPVYDLVIGNIQGARDPWNPDLSWNKPAPAHNIADTNAPVTCNRKTEDQVQGVQTRAIKVKAEAPTSQLKVPPSRVNF